MCLADARMFMPGLNLAYTDRASMAASTEVRVPFVDPVVFAAAFSLPGSDKIRGRVQKAALKDAAGPGCPDEIIDRPKASLRCAAARVGHQRPARAHRRRPACGGELVGTGFLRREPLQRLVADQRAGRRDDVQADLAAAEPRALVPQRARRGWSAPLTSCPDRTNLRDDGKAI